MKLRCAFLFLGLLRAACGAGDKGGSAEPATHYCSPDVFGMPYGSDSSALPDKDLRAGVVGVYTVAKTAQDGSLLANAIHDDLKNGVKLPTAEVPSEAVQAFPTSATARPLSDSGSASSPDPHRRTNRRIAARS